MQTFTPIEYLKIDVATNFGLDKETWDTRIAWFDEHESELDSLASQADEPAMFFAGVQAYRKAAAGGAIGYPISLDATASGAQILAALIGCEKSARLCNVIDTGRREDLYTNIYGFMRERLADMPAHLQPDIVRDDSKQAVMTSLYGSTAEPKRVFGEDTPALHTFYEVMQQETPGIWKLNNALLGLWNPKAYSHEWILPDNFHAKIKVMRPAVADVIFDGKPIEVHIKQNAPDTFQRSLGANVVHSIDGLGVRELVRRCKYDPEHIAHILESIKHGIVGTSNHRKQDEIVLQLWKNAQESGFLSARILDYLDVQNLGLVGMGQIKDLILSMPEKPFNVLTVHD